MGILVLNLCFVFGDNQLVLWNTTCPDSLLRKKTSCAAYNFLREVVPAYSTRNADNKIGLKDFCGFYYH